MPRKVVKWQMLEDAWKQRIGRAPRIPGDASDGTVQRKAREAVHHRTAGDRRRDPKPRRARPLLVRLADGHGVSARCLMLAGGKLLYVTVIANLFLQAVAN